MQDKANQILLQLKLLHEKNEYQKYMVACCTEEIAETSKNAVEELRKAAEGKYYFFSAPAYGEKYCRILDVLTDRHSEEIRLKVAYASEDNSCAAGTLPLATFAQYAKEIPKEEYEKKIDAFIKQILKELKGATY